MMGKEFENKLESILFVYATCPVAVVYDVMRRDLLELLEEAYSQGCRDGEKRSDRNGTGRADEET